MPRKAAVPRHHPGDNQKRPARRREETVGQKQGHDMDGRENEPSGIDPVASCRQQPDNRRGHRAGDEEYHRLGQPRRKEPPERLEKPRRRDERQEDSADRDGGVHGIGSRPASHDAKQQRRRRSGDQRQPVSEERLPQYHQPGDEGCFLQVECPKTRIRVVVAGSHCPDDDDVRELNRQPLQGVQRLPPTVGLSSRPYRSFTVLSASICFRCLHQRFPLRLRAPVPHFFIFFMYTSRLCCHVTYAQARPLSIISSQ